MPPRWCGRFEMARMVRAQRWLPALRLIGLVALTAIAWCVMLNRVSLAAWQTPLDYQGDSLIVLSRIKAASDGHYWPLAAKNVPQLGAPFIANWDAHPTSEDLLYLAMGLLARVVGLFPAANLGVLFAHLLAAVSFYAACRMLRCRWEWAFTCAIAFALSPYLFFRSLPHIMLAYAWHVPLVLCAGWWLSTSHGLRPGSRRFWLTIAIAIVTGLQNAYYTFLLVQLAALAFVMQVARRGGRRQVIAPVLFAGVAMAGWLFGNFDSLLFRATSSRNVVTASRPYAELETFALKPVALLTPMAGHRWEMWNEWGQSYRRNTSPFNEAHYAYIGLLGIGAVAVLVGVSVLRQLRGARSRLPFQTGQMLWIVLFSVTGGVNAMLGMVGFTLFRGTNRYSIAILALALLFLAQWLTGLTRQQPAWARLSLAAALCLLAAWDQLPRLTMPSEIAHVARMIESDRDFAQRLETRLPSGAMVFQLPMMEFPEAPMIHRMTSYQHLRPYLFTSSLRFSFGNHKNNFGSRWQEELDGLDAPELARALEQYGFAAIQINRAGFADRGAALIEALRASGRTEMIESARGDLVAILLWPESQPKRPVVWVDYSDGWHAPESDAQGNKQRWSAGDAQIVAHNNSDQPVTRYLTFQIYTLTARQVRLSLGDQTLAELNLADGEMRDFPFLAVTLQPGDNVLRFTTNRPAEQASWNDQRQVAFLIRNFRVRAAP